MVRDEAWKRAIERPEMKLLIGSFSTAFLLAFVWGVIPFFVPSLAYISSVRVLDYSISAIELGFFSAACLFVLGALMISKIPPEYHNKQIEEINTRDIQVKELRDTWEGELAKSNLRITECNDILTSPKMGIEMFNGHYRQALTIQSIKLKHMRLMPDNLLLDIEISQIGREFNEQEIIIPPRQQKFEAIAEATADDLVFFLKTRYTFNKTRCKRENNKDMWTTQFAIELSVDGTIADGRAMHTEIVNGRIIWVIMVSDAYFHEGEFKKFDSPRVFSVAGIGEVTHEPKTEEPSNSTAQKLESIV